MRSICCAVCLLALGADWFKAVLPQDSKSGLRASDGDRAAIGLLIEWIYREMSPSASAETRPRELPDFGTVFAPGALVHAVHGREQAGAVTPEQWLKMLRQPDANGWSFLEISRHVDSYGGIAQVFSTWEAKAAVKDRFPQARGIIGIQLRRGQEGWRIASVACSHEELADQPLPAEYLPK